MHNVVARLDGKDAPLLLRLRLVNNAGPDWEGDTFTTTPPVLFALKLDTLVLGHIYLGWKPFTWWSSLKTLELCFGEHIWGEERMPTIIQFIDMLASCPYLENLTLDSAPIQEEDLWANGTEVVPRMVVTLPSLNSLTLDWFNNLQTFCSIILLLHAPNLEELALTRMDESMDGSQAIDMSDAIASLGRGEGLGACLADVKRLRVACVCCSSLQSWEGLYGRMCNLQNLRIVHRPWEDDPSQGGAHYFHALQQTTTQGKSTSTQFLCPHLEELWVSGLDEVVVERLLLERQRQGYPLQRIFVDQGEDLWLSDLGIVVEEYLEEYYEHPA